MFKEPHSLLKQQLLHNNISFLTVRDALMQLDQSTPTRDASIDNLNFLMDEDIVAYIDTQHTDIQDAYHKFISFTAFHVGQSLALKQDTEALSYFQQALTEAQKGNFGSSWIAYIEGTMLYLQGKTIPEDLIGKVTESRNAEILRNFNEGLVNRGDSQYKEDYMR